MPKSSKRFILSDDSINNDGFVVLTSGGDLAQFKRNPVMLWMHMRATSGKKDDVLPLGYWDDIEMKDGELSAVPFFDDEDPFAMSIYNKVENGSIRMASSGLTPVDGQMMKLSELTKLRVSRTGRNPSTGEAVDIKTQLSEEDDKEVPVVTKWTLREASIVDMGSNNNSVALYDKDYQPIQLKDSREMITLFAKQTPTKIDTMNIELKAVAVELQLADDAPATAIVAAVQKLKTDKATAEKALADVQLASVKKDIDVYLSDAVAKGKIVEAQKAGYIKLAGEGGENFQSVKEIVDAMPEYKGAAKRIEEEGNDELEGLLKLSWSELDESNKLIRLKDLSPEKFRERFKAQFGVEYKK